MRRHKGLEWNLSIVIAMDVVFCHYRYLREKSCYCMYCAAFAWLKIKTSSISKTRSRQLADDDVPVLQLQWSFRFNFFDSLLSILMIISRVYNAIPWSLSDFTTEIAVYRPMFECFMFSLSCWFYLCYVLSKDLNKTLVYFLKAVQQKVKSFS